MRRFPAINLILLSVSAGLLWWVGNLAETHCSIGFGGIQCVEPYIGWGETLLAMMFAAIGLIAIFTISIGWLGIRWWQSRRSD